MKPAQHKITKMHSRLANIGLVDSESSRTILNKLNARKADAKRRGIIFELSDIDALNITSQKCYYCNTDEKIGIDRVNNSLGYNINNCVACCSICNKAKSTMSVSEFYNWIQKVYKFRWERESVT